MTDGGYDFIGGVYGFTCRIGEAVRIVHEDDAGVDDDYDELDVSEYDDAIDDRRSWVLAEIVDRVAGEVVIAREDGTAKAVTTDDIASDVLVDDDGRPIGSEAAWPFEYDDANTADGPD